MRHWSIAYKALLVVAFSVIILGLSVGVVAFLTARKTTQDLSVRSVDLVLEKKVEAAQTHFNLLRKTITLIAGSPNVIAGIRELQFGWDSVSGDRASELRAIFGAAASKGRMLTDPGDSSLYSQMHIKYHPWLLTAAETQGAKDIFLVNPEGIVIYTLEKDPVFTRNLADETDKSATARFYRALLSGPDDAILIQDFEPHLPDIRSASMLIGRKVLDRQGGRAGALIVSIGHEVLERIFAQESQNDMQLFVVAEDRTLRVDLASTPENDIYFTKVPDADWSILSSATSGSTITVPRFSPDPLFYVTRPFAFEGIAWQIYGAISPQTMNAPVVAMRNQMMLAGAGIILLVIVGGLLYLRQLVGPIPALEAAMLGIAEGKGEVDIPPTHRKDEIGRMSAALVTLRNAVRDRDAMTRENLRHAEAQTMRQHYMDGEIDAFRVDCTRLMDQFVQNSGALETTANQLLDISAHSHASTAIAQQASARSSQIMVTVASAASELTASISEIDRNLQETNGVVAHASVVARTMSDKVLGLSDAANKIGSVISLIQNIAAQTNLLALNATIEAARAGVAGKGFSVVASEVKSLALQTADATEEIAVHIASIQGATQGTVEAIDAIVAIVADIDRYTGTVTAAIGEQRDATQEISNSVEGASQALAQTLEVIDTVSRTVEETQAAAARLFESSTIVERNSTGFSETVEGFLRNVRHA